MAFPLATLTLHDFVSRRALLDNLASRALAEQVELVVLGFPLNLDGGENEMCARVRNFAQRLKRRLPIPFYLEPETLTTVEAMGQLRECGIKKQKLAGVIDQQAACGILNSFLNRHPSSRVPFG